MVPLLGTQNHVYIMYNVIEATISNSSKRKAFQNIYIFTMKYYLAIINAAT